MDDLDPPLAGRVLSHGHPSEPLDQTIARIRDKIVARGDLDYVSVKEQLSLLKQLAEFPFGQFLLQNRGWNGFWTDYVMQHPEHGRLTGTAPDGRPLTRLERQLLDTFPIVLATQERARHFAAAIQGHVKPGAVLASIPCGLMRDLLGCDFADAAGIRLVGVDIDSDSLAQAERLAETRGLAPIATFLRSDAWMLDQRETFDLIASNGLNIYEPDDDRVVQLYRGFHDALKPGGVLVTSALTPPPNDALASEWLAELIDPQALRMQRVVFADIIGTTFQCYRNSETTQAQLSAGGFRNVQVIWDSARIFPTFIVTA
jgi:SAM-dependent methyltransferase